MMFIAASLILVVYNIWDGNRAKEASDEIVSQLDGEIPDSIPAPAYEPEKEMPQKEINGYWYIGVLDIPDSGLHLPVMVEWDYERLKISPCRYSGSYYTDDLVICAHNYARHFSPIRWLDIGAEVYFTNVEGEVYKYEVSNRETVQPTSVDQMIENQSSTGEEDWDLTLFTCYTGGQTRCAVRCIRVLE